jgi:hypothetical protein
LVVLSGKSLKKLSEILEETQKYGHLTDRQLIGVVPYLSLSQEKASYSQGQLLSIAATDRDRFFLAERAGYLVPPPARVLHK